MHLGASQALNGTLCFFHSSAPQTVLLPTRPPTSAFFNKAGDANVGVWLFTGMAGGQSVPMHP